MQEDGSSEDEKGEIGLSQIPSKKSENSRRTPITLFWGDNKNQASEAQGSRQRILPC